MLRALAVLCCCGALSAGESVRYEVVHRTAVEVPAGIETLRVFHAVPMTFDRRAMRTLAVVPESPCEMVAAKDGVGHWWRWELDAPEPGERTFTTTFTLESETRVLDRERAARVRWRTVERDWRRFAAAEEREAPIAAVREVAADLRVETPLATLEAVCAWVRDEIDYDANVDHRTRNVAAIFRERSGWCGHQRTAFVALCDALHLPSRTAFGLSLKNRDGLWNGRADWNRHTWAEVKLGRLGWVEIDPAADDPFTIPARLIRNPPSLQSHAVWVERGGSWSFHRDHVNTVRAEVVE